MTSRGVSPAFAQQGPTTDHFTLDIAGLLAWLSSDLRVDVSNGRTGTDHLNVVWRPAKHFGIGGGWLFDRLVIEGERGNFIGRIQSGFNGPRVYVQIGG